MPWCTARRRRKVRPPPKGGLPLLTENPRRGVVGNPYSYTRIPIQYWGVGKRNFACSPALFSELPRETVWKVLGGCSGGLRCAPWRAGDTPQICPTMNGVASAHIFLSPQGRDALGFTAYGRSSTPSSTSLRAVARGGCCRRISRPGRASTTGSEDGASTGRGSA